MLPQKRYCDITGLEVSPLPHLVEFLFCPDETEAPPRGQAKYQDPRSTLRYHNAKVYEVLRTFQPAVIQAYLAVRGQGVVLR